MVIDPWKSVWVSLVHADLYPCLPTWKIPASVSVYDGLFYIVKGRGQLVRDGKTFDAAPGDLFVTRTGHEYSIDHDPARPVTVYSTGFLLHGPGNSDALRPYAFPDRMRLPAAARRQVESAYMELVGAVQDSTPSGNLAARGALLQLLALAMRLSAELPRDCCSDAPPALAGDETRAAAVTAFIDDNIGKPLTLEGLARRAHLSPVYFAAMFRRHTGQSPMAYVRERRMEIARAHLARGDESVERIARRVGFADPFHFSRVFRRIVGASPSAYRKQSENPFRQ